MRFHKSSPIILSSVLCLLLSIKADTLVNQKCSKITTEIECTDSLDASLCDGTKCLPIYESTFPDNETIGINVGPATCASWRDVQNNNLQINYQANHDDISSAENNQISELVYFTTWAKYAMNAKEGETLLADLKIVENEQYGTRMIMGYDAASNSIISSFRGSSNLMNWLLNIDIIKIPYNVEGCTNCLVHKGFNTAY